MATLKDVAKETGLTVSTVSRVLNNRGYISEETRKKVYEAIPCRVYSSQKNQLPSERGSPLALKADDEYDRCDRTTYQTSVFCGTDQ